MSNTRQDAWNDDEDLLLAEVVLRHIREGSTQLLAFEEVGKKLSRTAAACGFRWNSSIRKNYSSAIEIARKKRKDKKYVTKDKVRKDDRSEDVVSSSQQIKNQNSIEKVRQDLTTLLSSLQDYEDINEKNNLLETEVVTLRNENEKLRKEVSSLQKNFKLVEEDYKALIEIMERARKMVVLQGDEDNRQVHFQMDKNGNLQRVEK